MISIHAPREGSDASNLSRWAVIRLFLSTLPARGATDYFTSCLPEPQFLSTLPARGATRRGGLRPGLQDLFLSTLPARGATSTKTKSLQAKAFLSTLPARGATSTKTKSLQAKAFLSTLPARGATLTPISLNTVDGISIHAPREGSDRQPVRRGLRQPAISIHAPREGSDGRLCGRNPRRRISIHAPREGSDLAQRQRKQLPPSFLSTLPARGATAGQLSMSSPKSVFLSTLPARGATAHHCGANPAHGHFYPRSPRGERPNRKET